MKNVLLGLSLLFAISASAQETKRIAAVNASFNNQHPDKFVLENDQIKITYESASSMRVDLRVQNKSDKSIDFLWGDSYFVLSGETYSANNAGESSAKLHAFHTEIIDVNVPHKIGPQASYIARINSRDKTIFDVFGAQAAYKKDGGHLVNRVVPTLLIDGKKQEYPITIELYAKKALNK